MCQASCSECGKKPSLDDVSGNRIATEIQSGKVMQSTRVSPSHIDRAIQFRQLHRGPEVLILPNAWDVASARIFEDAGFPAIATTSGGIAFSLGYPDGQRIPREVMLARIARIARALQVPLTADVESGYGSTPEDAARTASELMQAGVVGMNLEDAGHRPDQPLIDLQLASKKSGQCARRRCRLGPRSW